MKEGNEWYEKISPHEWYYGDLYFSYANVSANEMYKIETGQSEANYYQNGINVNGTLQQGYWQKISKEEANDFKIGLMYIHDYYYSSKIDGRNCYQSSGDNQICSKSWLDLWNEGNDADVLQTSELLMSRCGEHATCLAVYNEWVIGSAHGLKAGTYPQNSDYDSPVRPVFYLKSDIKLTGEGTYTNPFLIIPNKNN